VVDFFSRLSGAARRHVPRLRSISSLAVILNTCVAIFGFALIELPKVLSRIPAEVPLRVATGILGVAALGVTVWFIVGKPHKRAARYRLGAEICRSVIATWKLPETHRHIFRGLPSEYRQFLRGLLNLRRLEGPTLAGARSNQQATADVSNESISEYVTSRLDKQLSYYQREQNKAQRRFHWLVPLIAILASAQLLIELGGVVAWWRGHFPVTERANILHEILMFSRVVFAALTGMFITLLAVREATRRKGRYGEMLEVLKENAERLNFATHKQAACEVITDNERVLLAENIEWANTAKYPATV
jgi:hypothetical protein